MYVKMYFATSMLSCFFYYCHKQVTQEPYQSCHATLTSKKHSCVVLHISYKIPFPIILPFSTGRSLPDGGFPTSDDGGPSAHSRYGGFIPGSWRNGGGGGAPGQSNGPSGTRR